MKSSRYATFAALVLALLAARGAEAQRVGSFSVRASTAEASGENRASASTAPRRGAPGGLLTWQCVADRGLVVGLALAGSGREGDSRTVAYRFDDEAWDSVTVTRKDPRVEWYLADDRVAPFTLRAKRAWRLAIRAPAPGEVEYQYEFARADEALDRLSCARGTPVAGRPLPMDERRSDGVENGVRAVTPPIASSLRLGNFFVTARTDSASGEDRTSAIVDSPRGTAGRLLIWQCVTRGLVVGVGLGREGREGDSRRVAYRFDRDAWDSVTVSRRDFHVYWHIADGAVAPFTIRARRARELVIRAPGEAEVRYEMSRASEALGLLTCARGTPVAGRPLPMDDRETPPDEGTYELSAVEEVPRIRNRAEMQRLIEDNFPAALRGTGIKGSVVVRFRVMENGRVDPTTVSVEESTHEVFNAPAMRAVRGLFLTPAKVGGRPVRVWVTVPISFEADQAESDSTAAPPPSP